MFNINRSCRAFSIVELLLVLTVMGVLFSFIVPKANSILNVAKNMALKSIVKSLQIDIEAYFINKGFYPLASGLNISELIETLNTAGAGIVIPKNPFTGIAYSGNDESGKITYVYDGVRYLIKGFGINNAEEIISVGNE